VNKPKIPLAEIVAGAVSSQPVPSPSWHPTAAAWYRSLADSAQSQFYEPSDWATAWVVAESLSRDLGPKFVGLSEDGPVLQAMPLSGSSLSSYLRACAILLVTEGDRRRLQVEVTRAQTAPTDEAVTLLDEYRSRRPS
jgi:hypothetical protein